MRDVGAITRACARVTALVACGVALALLAAAGSAAAAPLDATLPSVTGKLVDGQRLSAERGAWSAQGHTAYGFSWLRCNEAGEACQTIAGATKRTLKLGHEDVGHTLRVSVTASDASGSSTATSAPSAVVAPLAPSRKSNPRVNGAAVDGQLLSATAGAWKGTPPFTLSYQWEACTASGEGCTPIPGARSAQYRVQSEQLGGRVRVVVSAHNEAGTASITSKATKKIEPGAPVNVAVPSVSGSLHEGETLSAGTGEWGGTAPIAFSYQWLRCSLLGGCEQIPGATGSSYTLEVADIASRLAVVVTASNAEGTASATSAETNPVLALLPSNTGLPSITGLLQEGQLLGVGSGSWSGTLPISYSYQWQLCNALGAACVDISEATAQSLKLSGVDVGGTLDVVVTATNVAGSTSVTTPLSGLIAGILPEVSSLPAIAGVLKEGQLLSVGSGSWSGTLPISYSYQWQLCNALGGACVDISEATAQSLKLSGVDVGGTLDVVVTATNVAGSTSVTTPVSGLIAGILPTNTVLPTISGLLKEGQLLSVGSGSWSGTEPISYGYQWQLCNALGKSCANIVEATSQSLKLSLADVGGTLDVVVKATNAAGSSSVTTSVTRLILGLL